jgi:hypothetical protein
MSASQATFKDRRAAVQQILAVQTHGRDRVTSPKLDCIWSVFRAKHLPEAIQAQARDILTADRQQLIILFFMPARLPGGPFTSGMAQSLRKSRSRRGRILDIRFGLDVEPMSPLSSFEPARKMTRKLNRAKSRCRPQPDPLVYVVYMLLRGFRDCKHAKEWKTPAGRVYGF